MSFEAISHVMRGGVDGNAITVPSNRRAGPLAVRLVLLVLAEHADPYGRGACPSQRTIAAESGLSRQSVADALAVLIEHELIVVAGEARPRRHGTIFDIPSVSAGVPRQSEPQLEVASRQGYPVRVNLNLDGDLDGGLDGEPRHEPEPEPCISPRDSYASDDERRLTVEQIRQLRAAKIDEGRDQLDDERIAQRAKNSRTAVA